ncbi:signal peptidase 22kDa subunit [Myxozyma melibiosi]|uniref:Signal peptidase subunit 3 n=1 Tax=Myxozyma melibiosi TaxID=54550 RepID=A0ABR1F2G2_9ASCO
MFSTFQRLQQYCGFVSSVVICIMAAISLSSFVHLNYLTPVPTASISVDNVQVKYGKPPYGYNYKRQEYASMTFDLDADLSPLFNWNTKQLFVYLAATYPGKQYANKVVFWDSIITSKEDAIISLRNTTANYQIYDVTGKFSERTATVSLEWNVQPYVGLLTFSKGEGRSKFTFPPLASASSQKAR